jgi:hypothetical protein
MHGTLPPLNHTPLIVVLKHNDKLTLIDSQDKGDGVYFNAGKIIGQNGRN